MGTLSEPKKILIDDFNNLRFASIDSIDEIERLSFNYGGLESIRRGIEEEDLATLDSGIIERIVSAHSHSALVYLVKLLEKLQP